MTAATTWDFASVEEKIDFAQDNYQTLISGYAWNQTTISFSFPLTAFAGTGSYLPAGESLQYTAFTQAEIDITLAIFDVIERFLDIDFVYDATGNGEIKIGHQNMTAGGYAQYPYAGSNHAVVISEDSLIGELGYGIQALIHEIGHSLGLEHPHEANTPLSENLDLNTSAIMSYDRLAMNGDENHRLNSFMLMDILALQSMYGVSTKVSNDVYTADNGISVIADYGGVDTIDISTQSYDSSDVNIIDLQRGYVFYDRQSGNWRSTIYDHETAQSTSWTDRNADNGFYNIIIAPGSSIERVAGSAVRDQIIGDGLANLITGNGGNDVIDGGGGFDIAVYSGFYSDYTVVWISSGAYTITDNAGNEGTDTLTSIETLKFSDRDIVESGTAPLLVDALDDQTAIERTAFTFIIPDDAFTDPNGDTLTYSAALAGVGELPSWLSFDPVDRTFTGTPAAGDSGSLSIVVTASDGTEFATDTFSLVINSRIGEDIVGTSRSDDLLGTASAEKIFGRGGYDIIHAGAENDRLIGGVGMDTLWGEAGADIFTYKSAAESPSKNGKFDFIMDFDRGEGDRIDVSAIDANVTKKGNQTFHFDKQGDGWGNTGQMSWWINDGQTLIYGNTDKDAKAEFYAVLDGVIHLRASDFIL